MKFRFDPLHGQISFTLQEKDMPHIFEIQKMMQTVGWQKLCQYHFEYRRIMESKNQEIAITNQSAEQSARLTAMALGMDTFISLADGLVNRMQEKITKDREAQIDLQEQKSLFEGVENI